jgi:hypothetical protein
MSTTASKLSRAIEGGLPDLSQWVQRIAAPCSALQRAGDPPDKTKPNQPAPAPEPATSGARLSATQRLAAAWLGEGHAVTEVAKTLGLHRATLFRWKHLPEFQSETRSRAEQFVSRHAPPQPARAQPIAATRQLPAAGQRQKLEPPLSKDELAEMDAFLETMERDHAAHCGAMQRNAALCGAPQRPGAENAKRTAMTAGLVKGFF